MIARCVPTDEHKNLVFGNWRRWDSTLVGKAVFGDVSHFQAHMVMVVVVVIVVGMMIISPST